MNGIARRVGMLFILEEVEHHFELRVKSVFDKGLITTETKERFATKDEALRAQVIAIDFQRGMMRLTRKDATSTIKPGTQVSAGASTYKEDGTVREAWLLEDGSRVYMVDIHLSPAFSNPDSSYQATIAFYDEDAVHPLAGRDITPDVLF